jgi:ATP/maltotriose-dependent transcriptional regulator MalT
MATTAAGLVGRETELAAIAGFLEAEAHACAVVIEGEAGIGKTSVWQAAVDAAARGSRVLRSGPAESDAKLAFSSLADLLGPALEEVLADLPPPQRRALEVALLLEDAGGRRADRRAVAAGLLSSLRALAAESRLVVAVDDLQWIDRSSAAALDFAVRRLREEPVTLLLARRLDSDDAGSGELRAPERLLRVPVGPLGFIPLNRLIHERLGTVLSRPLLRRIHELSGGNPFFALELARAPERLEEGRALPPTLDVLVRGRLKALPEETQLALLAAAAASQPTVELVDRVVGARDPLAAAEAAQIIEIVHGTVRFDHPLLASGAYAGAEPAQRRQVHGELGRLVQEPEERARHLAAAATGPDEDVAAALDEGAARARARGAPAAAAELSDQAAQLTPPTHATDARRRTVDAGYYHFESGDSRRALALIEEVVAHLPAGPERADALTRLARVRSYSDDLQAATDLFLQAAEEAGDDPLLRARALDGAAAQLLRRRERLDEAVEHAKTAAAVARELGDDALLGSALGSQLLAEATLGRPEATATLETALALQPALETERILVQPKWTAAVARMWWEEPSAVRETYEELIERGREIGDEGSLTYVYVMLAQADCLLGAFERGRRDAEAAREIAEQSGQQMLVGYALAVRAMSDVGLGRVTEARTAAELALELGQTAQFTPVVHFAAAALGLLELSLGRAEEATERLAPLIRFARAEQICEPGLTRYVHDHVEALVELDRLDEAGELLDWYEGNAVRLGRRGASAASRRCRGLLAAAGGRLDEALPEFEQALILHDAVSLPFDRARTLLVFGAALRRAKRKADARDTLEQCLAAFEELSAEAFADRARAELKRIGGRRRSEGGLTATERQIAELVAQGHSNKEVAAALFVTVKTVEANLSRVYAKLGLRSRAELARLMAGGEPAAKP